MNNSFSNEYKIHFVFVCLREKIFKSPAITFIVWFWLERQRRYWRAPLRLTGLHEQAREEPSEVVHQDGGRAVLLCRLGGLQPVDELVDVDVGVEDLVV